MKRLALLALAFASIASADPSPEALPHVEAGVAAYERGDYSTAISEFEIAYDIDGDPAILYAWAQAQRRAGHCDKALALYERYLATDPTEDQVAAAKTGMGLCEQAPAPPPTPVREETSPPTPPWYRDALGGGLVIGGVASLAFGTTFLVLANRSADAADTAPTRPEFLDRLDEATQRRRIGLVGVGLGSALVIAGVIRYVTHSDAPSSRVGMSTNGASLVVFGRF